MKKVLFPTDFSDVSLNAFQFALDYASTMGNKIIVFHAYDQDDQHNYAATSVYKEIDVLNYNKEPFPPIVNLITEKYKDVTIKYVVRKGKLINALTDYIHEKEETIDTVIMGTNDRNGIMKIFTEPKTIQIVETVAKPVIAVPRHTVFDGTLDNMVFLVDYKEVEKKVIGTLLDKVREFDTKLHVVHFDVAHREQISPVLEKFKGDLSEHGFDNAVFKSIDTIDVKKSLKMYCQENKIDLVCLMNRKLNFYQRLFTQSLAEELITGLNMPIMAIYHD